MLQLTEYIIQYIKYSCMFLCAQLLQLGLTLCVPMDCSLPGSSVHGIFTARILEQVAISFSRGIFLTQGSNLLCISWIARQILYHCSNWEDHKNIYIHTHTYIKLVIYSFFLYFLRLYVLRAILDLKQNLEEYAQIFHILSISTHAFVDVAVQLLSCVQLIVN